MVYERNDASEVTTSELASPGVRLVALIIDVLIYLIPALVVFIIFGGADDLNDISRVGSGLSTVINIAIFIVQMVLLVTRGQTIGKIVMKIRIVDAETGEHPGGWRIIMLRVIAHAILLVTIIYLPIDSLFIFRKDRRTIHDLIAQTRVDKVSN